ncbi:FAD:protein FMN transferase [Streptomyces albidoflavus]
MALCEDAADHSDGWFSITPAGRLTPSGLVKGWAVDLTSRLLLDAGARDSCVNGEGDLRVRGRAGASAPWRVGVAHPLRPGHMASVVTARHDPAIATSGTSERGCHILHPDTGVPVITSAAVTVVGPGLAMTDAFATAASARGDDALGGLGARRGSSLRGPPPRSAATRPIVSPGRG